MASHYNDKDEHERVHSPELATEPQTKKTSESSPTKSGEPRPISPINSEAGKTFGGVGRGIIFRARKTVQCPDKPGYNHKEEKTKVPPVVKTFVDTLKILENPNDPYAKPREELNGRSFSFSRCYLIQAKKEKKISEEQFQKLAAHLKKVAGKIKSEERAKVRAPTALIHEERTAEWVLEQTNITEESGGKENPQQESGGKQSAQLNEIVLKIQDFPIEAKKKKQEKKETETKTKKSSTLPPYNLRQRNSHGSVERVNYDEDSFGDTTQFNQNSTDYSEIDDCSLTRPIAHALYLKTLAQKNGKKLEGESSSSPKASSNQKQDTMNGIPIKTSRAKSPTTAMQTPVRTVIVGQGDRRPQPKRLFKHTFRVMDGKSLSPPAQLESQYLPELYPIFKHSQTNDWKPTHGLKILRQISPAVRADATRLVKYHHQCNKMDCIFHGGRRVFESYGIDSADTGPEGCMDMRETSGGKISYANPDVLLAKPIGNDQGLTLRSKKKVHQNLGVPDSSGNHACYRCDLHGQPNPELGWTCKVVCHSELALGQTRHREIIVADVAAIREAFQKFQDDVIMNDCVPNKRVAHFHASMPNQDSCLENGQRCTATVLKEKFMTIYPTTDGKAINMRCHGVCGNRIREHKLLLECTGCAYAQRLRIPEGNLDNTKFVIDKFDLQDLIKHDKIHTVDSRKACFETSETSEVDEYCSGW